MKSVVTAAWFINNAFGNLIVVVLTKLNMFVSQVILQQNNLAIMLTYKSLISG